MNLRCIKIEEGEAEEEKEGGSRFEKPGDTQGNYSTTTTSKALVALDEDEEERKKAQEHPKQYRRDKGVQIPGNPEVEVIPDNWSISICWKDICAKISF